MGELGPRLGSLYIKRHVLLCRITLPVPCSFRNVVESSRIHRVGLFNLDLGGLWGRTMVLLLRERTSTHRFWLLFGVVLLTLTPSRGLSTVHRHR